MTSSLAWVGLAGTVCAAFGTAFSATQLLVGGASPVAQAVRGYVDAMAEDLRFSRRQMTLAQLLTLQGGLSLGLIVWAVADRKWALLTMVPVIIAAPRTMLQQARARRITAIDAQIDAWLVVLANALRATPSLGEAIASTAKLVPAPLSEELELVMNEYHLGAPMDVALRTMGDRLHSRTVNVALGTLRIARNTGGDLPHTLEISAAALREIARLEGVVRTKTAEGKAQAAVIAVVPFPLVALLNHLSPVLLEPLFNTLKGYGILAAAILMWLVALLWARKILAVDI